MTDSQGTPNPGLSTDAPSQPSSDQDAPQQHLFKALDVLAHTQHAGSAVYSALFPACPALRDWVLCAAPRAHLTLHAANGCQRDAAAWETQLNAVRAAAGTRGKQHTTLTVVLDIEQAHGSHADALGEQIAEFIQHTGPMFSALTIQQGRLKRGPHFSQSLLQRSAPSLRHLTTLTLDGCNIPLPDPSKLPHVRSLCMRQLDPTRAVCKTTAAFLPIVTRFEFGEKEMWLQCGESLQRILTQPISLSHSLTELVAAVPLDSELLGCILSRFPALRRLHVWALSLSQYTHRSRQWGVEWVRVEYHSDQCTDEASDMELHSLRQLACLPQRTAGSMVVSVPRRLCLRASKTGLFDDDALVVGTERPAMQLQAARAAQQAREALLARVKTWQFEVKDAIVLVPGFDCAPPAYRLALQDLAQLQAPGACVELQEWDWTPEVVSLVADILPTLPTHFKFQIGLCELTDESLGAVLQAPGCLRHLSCARLNVWSDQHYGTVWPWEEFVCEESVDMASLANMPDPRGGVRVIRAARVMVAQWGALPEGEYERLQSRLPHFRFAPLKTQGDDQEPDSIEVYIHSTSESPLEPRLAHLDLVRAMRFDSSETERSVVLRLDGTSSDDPHVSDVLRALPHWNCTLGIEEPNWLLEPPCAENRLRVPLIPTTFHTWVLPAFPDSAADDVSAVLRAVVRDALGSEGGFPSLIDGCV